MQIREEEERPELTSQRLSQMREGGSIGGGEEVMCVSLV